MENIYSIGLQVILWLQRLGAWLTPIMQLFTFLGSGQFYFVAISIIFWCIDATLGLRLGLFQMINITANEIMKVVLHGPRPYWYSSDVKTPGSAENSFGAPSGHAQDAVVFWGTLAHRIKTRAAWIIATLIIILIGISRVYLAVHFPHDVLLGWLFGAIMLWILLRLEIPTVRWIKQYSIGMQLLLVFLFTLVLLFIMVIVHFTLGGWSVPPIWINNAHLAFPSKPPITPLSYDNSLSSTGAFFGLAAGWLWLERTGGFSTRGSWPKLLLRFILGIIGVAILYIGLGRIFPSNDTIVAYFLRYFQFALLGFWISGFAPWVFIKLKLASHTR